MEQLESLNLGLLHVLLTLSPLERAVFLLREAFDYPYEDIARLVGRRADSCRQLAHRARDRVRSQKADVAVDSELHEELLQAFLSAAQGGDLARLEGMLADDAVLVSDGGGKVVSATRPVVGPSNIARFFAGIAQKAPEGTEVVLRPVNGAPAALILVEGHLDTVFSLQTAQGRIYRVFAVRNPEKLVGLAASLGLRPVDF